MAKKKKKPAPIDMRLAKRAPRLAPDEPLEPFNDVSPITAEQMARAEQSIDHLREEVKSLRKQPAPKIQVETPTPQVVIPARARIAKVTIKYDTFGTPIELIPRYAEPAV